MPHVDAMKRSACIEGAQMALAHVKTYWRDMKASVVASQDSDEGRVSAEHFLEGSFNRSAVLEGCFVRIASAIVKEIF